MNRVLVTGGAGYIGSAVVDLLVERGDHVVVIDDLSGGHREAVHESAIFVEAEIGDSTLVEAVLAEHAIDSVIHFAGRIAVGESVRDPALYLDANVAQSIRLLAALRHRRSGPAGVLFLGRRLWHTHDRSHSGRPSKGSRESLRMDEAGV